MKQKIYLLKSKAFNTRNAIKDFKTDFGKDIKIFTEKNFFYQTIVNDVKYIHKESYMFYLTNGYTYSQDVIPYKCDFPKNYLDEELNNEILKLILSKNEFLPDIKESEHFYYHKIVQGESITDISDKEFFELKEIYDKNDIIPFYNSMCYNIVRSVNGLKLVDLKHFEFKDNKPFFVYLNNVERNINTLYIEESSDLEIVLAHLKRDYNITNENIKFIKD